VNLSAAEIEALQAAIPTMPVEEQLSTLQMLERLEKQMQIEDARSDLLAFAHEVYPNYAVGAHHRHMAKLFKDVVDGKKSRIIINIAPRFGKSELTSYLLPAWFLGHRPDAKIIMATHTQSLSEDFGRRVRNLIADPDYQRIFPETTLQTDSKSAGNWNTRQGGKYFAAGVGGSIAGRGADLLVIDDPHSEQDIKTGTRLSFDTAFNWYQTGPRQRLMWGAAIIVVMCMTGDTPVLMADGSEKPLRDVVPGDEVATYEDGRLSTARVLNHRSNGVDDIYCVRTRSGRMLRANERHPFLVDFEGERRWVRLRDLKPGMSLVAFKGVGDRPEIKNAQDCAAHVVPRQATTARILTPAIVRWATTASGRARRVLAATRQRLLSACVSAATTRGALLARKLPSIVAGDASSTGTASRWSSTKRWLQSAVTDATCAASRLLRPTLARTGTASSVSTTITRLDEFEGFCATTAISQSATGKPAASSNVPRPTCDEPDEIVSIVEAGREEVFDVQVERTENFIASGVVSHNTRWATYDLTARLLDYAAKNPDADQWEVVEFPAIMPSGKSLWPEKWSTEALLRTKASLDPKYWTAQYMQQPSSDEAAIIARDHWRVWEKDRPPSCEYVIQSLDAAAELNTRRDFTSITTWGVFKNEYEDDDYQLILLDRVNQRMQFPEMKAKALEQYKQWDPDCFIVEKKNNGTPLYQEMRYMGLPVQEYTPHRGSGDKVARLNAVADIVKSGKVWIPDTWWARELIDQVAQFPNGMNDDDVDTTAMALMRFRQGGYLSLKTDDILADKTPFQARRAAYY